MGVSADEASKQSISKGWPVAEGMVKITHEAAAVKAAEQIDFARSSPFPYRPNLSHLFFRGGERALGEVGTLLYIE